VFDQLAVQFPDLRLPFAGGRLFLVFAAGIGRVGHNFIAQHVQHPVEAGAGFIGTLNGKTCRPNRSCTWRTTASKSTFSLSTAFTTIIFRDAVAGRVIPHPVGADAQPVLRVNHHQREIADAQRAQPFADEVEVTGVSMMLNFSPIHSVCNSEAETEIWRFFSLMWLIRHRETVGDAAHAGGDAAAHEHGLAKHCLPDEAWPTTAKLRMSAERNFHSGISFNFGNSGNRNRPRLKGARPVGSQMQLCEARRGQQQWFACAIL